MKPPEEKFSQILVARGRVASPIRRRQKAHQRQLAVSLLPMVQTPSIVAIAKGSKKKKKRKGEVGPNLESSKTLFMTELLQMNLLT
jgi:hypothetical protein